MERFLALKASAGSGKTFALTVRYIVLLLKGAKPSEILTLTFTNKAANEMSQRIYNTLLNLGEDEAYLNEIVASSQLTKDEVLKKKNQLLNSFLNSTVNILTIDKFVNKILREFCTYIAISDDFEIKKDDEELLSYKFLQSLDSESFEDLIEFSIYESKKFNSIFKLFNILLEKNENITLLEIKSNFINLQKEIVLTEALKIKEYFESCENISNNALKAVNFNSFDELFDKTWINKNSLFEYSYFKKFANSEVEIIFSNLKNQLEEYYKIRSSYSLNKIFKLYLNFKKFKLEFNKVNNYFNFSDITNLVYELLNDSIDKDFLYFRLDSTYNHILIDEFQDTSTLQYKILAPLIDEIFSQDDEIFKTFFYVGDPKQSIYRFRGGKRELFDYLSSTNSLIKVENLNTNYRSGSTIVNYVNDVFNNLENYDYIEQNSIKDGGFAKVIQDDNLVNEDKYFNILEEIKSLIEKGINADDIAVLCYTNSDVLELYYYLKEYLPKLKVKTDLTSKLINQNNVKALINLVKYIYFKEDIYKENFNALTQNKFFSSVYSDFNLENRSLSAILYDMARHFNLIDENVVKLIENSSIWDNIVDFVYNVDNLDTDIQNIQDRGLQILTIYKSKGLEFHTVILLDRIKRKNYDKSSLLFEYENIKLKNIFYKISNFENFNEDYKLALGKEEKLVLDDEKNVLYVALTRAKNNLIIFKKEKSSVFEILRLQVCEIGTLVLSETNKKEKELNKIEYIPLNLGLQEQKIVNIKDDENIILKAKYFGLATHYVLEMMSSFTLSALEYSLNLSKARYSNYLDEGDFDRVYKLVKNLIENEFFQSLVKDSQIFCEQALIYNEEIKILDLLLYKDDCYYILDYKTTTDILSEHKYQVNAYKNAISTIFSTKNVKGFLLYLTDDCVKILEV